MSKRLPDTIEFINGPFDGHIEVLSVAAEALPGDLACFVNENVFRMINGQYRLHESRVTSVAIYEREHRITGWAYVFSGASAPQGANLEKTQGGVFGKRPEGDS